MKLNKIKESIKSIRFKLFVTLGVAVLIIIFILVLSNNIILDKFFLYSKQKTLLQVCNQINEFYNEEGDSEELTQELQEIAINNNFDILIQKENYINVYTSNRKFGLSNQEINKIINIENGDKDILYKKNETEIRKILDTKTNSKYILLSSKLNNNYFLYIKLPMGAINDSVKISNTFLYLMGGITIIIAGGIILYVSRKFTKPIVELNEIAERMAELDFSKKYEETLADDEINNLGKSINKMSCNLEKTIEKLKNTNLELEKDIEEKSKIDEMRRTFISDVSHELKTPIALIQGYSEGLVENVNEDEENRKYYAEVILDEANKMDKLVKQLLELMKLEYGKREFNNTVFDICELINEVLTKREIILKEKNIEIKFDSSKKINVIGDEFYIEQVITNYITNAVKNTKEIENIKYIEIIIEDKNENIRVNVFNTGDRIKEENLNKIWERFYKEDKSRKREDSGSGIGLSIVKAIMNNYGKEYGVKNKKNGVEFYFELEKDSM